MVKCNQFWPCLQSWNNVFVVIRKKHLNELIFSTSRIACTFWWISTALGGAFDSFKLETACAAIILLWLKRHSRVFCFMRRSSTHLTIERVVRGKVCVLHFAKLIEPFVGEEFFFWCFVCFQEWIKICCLTPEKVHEIQKLNVSKI